VGVPSPSGCKLTLPEFGGFGEEIPLPPALPPPPALPAADGAFVGVDGAVPGESFDSVPSLLPVSKAAMADMDFLELFIEVADISANAASEPIGCIDDADDLGGVAPACFGAAPFEEALPLPLPHGRVGFAGEG